jgi:hypothetical protein
VHRPDFRPRPRQILLLEEAQQGLVAGATNSAGGAFGSQALAPAVLIPPGTARTANTAGFAPIHHDPCGSPAHPFQGGARQAAGSDWRISSM